MSDDETTHVGDFSEGKTAEQSSEDSEDSEELLSDDETTYVGAEQTIDLIPIMTIREEGSDKSDRAFVQRNIRHTEWLNDEFKAIQQMQLKKILNKEGKGLFIVHNLNPEKIYKYFWTNVEAFGKKRIPEPHKSNIVQMIEWAKPSSITLFFCDMDATMTLYHIV